MKGYKKCSFYGDIQRMSRLVILEDPSTKGREAVIFYFSRGNTWSVSSPLRASKTRSRRFNVTGESVTPVRLLRAGDKCP